MKFWGMDLDPKIKKNGFRTLPYPTASGTTFQNKVSIGRKLKMQSSHGKNAQKPNFPWEKKFPMEIMKVPMGTMKGPMGTMKGPMGTMKVPMGILKVPMGALFLKGCTPRRRIG